MSKKKKKIAPAEEQVVLRRVTAFDFSFTSIDGLPMPLGVWAGRPLLIVNTASKCGFTPQYQELQELWETYRDRGLVVIGVTSNDFGKQEPWGEEKVRAFCTKRYGVNFPLTAKTRVFGLGKHPFYKYAGRWAGFVGTPKWNFHKYLVSPEGYMFDWFFPFTSPMAPQVTQAIEFLLPPVA